MERKMPEKPGWAVGKCLWWERIVGVLILTSHQLIGILSIDSKWFLEVVSIKLSIQSKEKEINEIVKTLFSFDNYRWQQENNIIIDEPNRADSLNRILYKCPNCLNEGDLIGKGTTLTCPKCGKETMQYKNDNE